VAAGGDGQPQDPRPLIHVFLSLHTDDFDRDLHALTIANVQDREQRPYDDRHRRYLLGSWSVSAPMLSGSDPIAVALALGYKANPSTVDKEKFPH